MLQSAWWGKIFPLFNNFTRLKCFSPFFLPNGSQITSNKRIWPTLWWKIAKEKRKVFLLWLSSHLSVIIFLCRWCDTLKLTRRTCDLYTRTRFFFFFLRCYVRREKVFPLMLLLQQIFNNNKERKRKVFSGFFLSNFSAVALTQFWTFCNFILI